MPHPSLETRQDLCQAAFAAFEQALSVTSPARQAGIADATSTLFLLHADTLDHAASEMFERIFLLQIRRMNNIEELIGLSANTALIEKLPISVILALAASEAVAVASPVLAQCRRLPDADLAQLAGRLGQAHLRAMAARDELSEAVTEILIRRGDSDVIDQLAANAGARFRRVDFVKLLQSAQTDERGRVLVRQPADLLSANGKSFGQCVTIDMTPIGAQLKFSAPTPIPQSFSLQLNSVERLRLACKPAWRSGDVAGIQFVSGAAGLWGAA